MAAAQFLEKLVPVVFLAIIAAGGSLFVGSCRATSKELHICLNIYLEKDFPFIETIIKGRGRALLDDRDLQNICSHLTTLYDCYKNLLGECDAYWQLDRYSRLMNLLNATHTYLCSSQNRMNLEDLLLNARCLNRVPSLIANCSESGFSWLATWKEILRMQVSPSDRCPVIGDFRTCLTSSLENVICGAEASRVYGNLLGVWLQSWCDWNSTSESASAYLYLPVTFHQN